MVPSSCSNLQGKQSRQLGNHFASVIRNSEAMFTCSSFHLKKKKCFTHMRDTWFLFHLVWTIQFRFFQFQPRPLSYVAIIKICMQCACSMNSQPHTSDLYFKKAQYALRAGEEVLMRERPDNRPWIYKGVLSNNVVLIESHCKHRA